MLPENNDPIIAVGLMVVLVKTGTGGVTEIVKVLSAVEPLLLALTSKVAVPSVVGVPEITPPEERESPPAPVELTRLYSVTGLADSVAEYAVPLIAAGRVSPVDQTGVTGTKDGKNGKTGGKNGKKGKKGKNGKNGGGAGTLT
jgi:hypothetical protein